jgi:hypothetical protein
MKMSFDIPAVEACDFEVDADGGADEVETSTSEVQAALVQVAYELGLLQYVMFEPSIGEAS